MARKLSPITSAKLTILSETTKGKVGKAERQSKMVEKMSFLHHF